ncbi:MAG TPA: YdeI/OmpD-associated family protein [Ignavibacteria bacterium]|nr:YdeI/OmpD-associated family protein [Ignavibacteria bacterium]
MKRRTFSAEILIIGVNPYVRPPDSILKFIFKQAGKETSPIPVEGKVNGAAFQQTLVRYSGDWRLYINNVIAKAAGLKFTKSVTTIAGQKIKVTIAFNPSPPTFTIPILFQKALLKDRKAKAAFDKLTPGRQKEIARYLGSLKTQDSLKLNIKRVFKHLRGKKTDGLHALMGKK